MTDTIEPTFEFVDEVPDRGNPKPRAELTCVTCGTALTYSGRGAKPKYCDQHRKYDPRRQGAGMSAGRSNAIAGRAITELTMMYSLAGAGLRFVDPIAGGLVTDNAEKLAESWRLLIETNAKVRKLFLEIEGGAAWLPVVIVHADLIGSIWLAHGLAKAARQAEKEQSERVDSDIV
jgi:hypothetical protein